MSERPLLLRNARLIDPAGGTDTRGALLIQDGVIADLGPNLATAPEGAEIVDCGGAALSPGLVDMRAFFGEPGAEHRETIRSGSLAAAAGGVTTVVCMPDTDPVIDDPAIVDYLLRRARDNSVVNLHPAAALTKGLRGQEMTEIGLLKLAGAVCFTDGARSVANARVMTRALTYARDFDALIVHHTEDPDLAGTGVMNAGEYCSRLGLSGRPAEAEAIMLERDVRLVRMTRSRYHAAIITCRDSIEIARRAKEAGLPFTCGTSINHLSFNETDIGDYRTFFKVSPPLRAEEDRQALAEALAEGLIDIVVSDHNPQDVEQKRQPFAESSDGALGLETMLSAGLRLVNAGHLSLPHLLRSLSTRPADLLGLPGGRLVRGAPADLVLFDPERPFVLDPRNLHSKSKNTPFDEARLEGVVLRTLVAGRTVYQ
ncbi:dihydroorotase [Terrihabitans rhizophilus]|uniref:Dihydroorotase n=1 Tax=Terrihabitans rhizophilus TaxID=3092662 RepID=A0ABU4RKS3_9HYPH|nr:dihydroorotase [Terrihabitans sp. PJ23]MDX6805181.1 dihydroorotase [Terrihabitans sp. PJ23]